MGKIWAIDLIPSFFSRKLGFSQCGKIIPEISSAPGRFRNSCAQWLKPWCIFDPRKFNHFRRNPQIKSWRPEVNLQSLFSSLSTQFSFQNQPKAKKQLWCSETLPSWAPREVEEVQDSLLGGADTGGAAKARVGPVAAPCAGWQWHPSAARVGTAPWDLHWQLWPQLKACQEEGSSSLPSTLQFDGECLGRNLDYSSFQTTGFHCQGPPVSQVTATPSAENCTHSNI